MPVVRRTVYTVEYANGADGVKVAVWVGSSYAIEPGTAPPALETWNVDDVMVDGSTVRENCTEIVAVRATLVAFETGVVESTPSGPGSPFGTRTTSAK
jgi:hypothetical protein